MNTIKPCLSCTLPKKKYGDRYCPVVMVKIEEERMPGKCGHWAPEEESGK